MSIPINTTLIPTAKVNNLTSTSTTIQSQQYLPPQIKAIMGNYYINSISKLFTKKNTKRIKNLIVNYYNYVKIKKIFKTRNDCYYL